MTTFTVGDPVRLKADETSPKMLVELALKSSVYCSWTDPDQGVIRLEWFAPDELEQAKKATA